MSFLSIPDRETTRTLVLAGAATAVTLLTARRLLTTSTPTIPSPLSSVRQLSPAAQSALPYPPSTPLLPGGSDVSTPWGSMRIYEFGSSARSARKVVFLHGISTPCISLSRVARLLAHEHSCRVLLLDLFGRGFSDAPADVPYDGRLYAAQLLAALAHVADPAGWARFTLVGYSLGGGLAADFASYFPARVAELVLLAPGGLVRPQTVSLRSRVLYSRGWLPDALLRWLVGWRLGVGAARAAHGNTLSTSTSSGSMRSAGAAAEQSSEPITAELPAQDPEETEKDFDYSAAVSWQLAHHAGFVRAFMWSMRDAPIEGQQERWGIVGRRQAAARVARRASVSLSAEAAGEMVGRAWATALDSTRALLVLGEADRIVRPEHVAPDARDAFGADNVAVVTLKGAGHELPITHAGEVVAAMVAHWGGGGGGLQKDGEEEEEL